MFELSNEEESKKARILEREKREELQLIIERCNKIPFEYVKVLPERLNDKVVFGSSSKSRRIHFFADDKCLNSYMRRCFKEHFPEPLHIVKEIKKSTDELLIEQKPSPPFASRVPRFQEIIVDSSQGYKRKKKVQELVHSAKTTSSAFGASSDRTYMITREIKENNVPISSYIEKSRNQVKHNILPAYLIVCSPKSLDSKCDLCECEIKNVYWKNAKTHSVLCRKCYNDKLYKIRNKSRGVIERFRNLKIMENDYKRLRHCSFYHDHKNTTAHVYYYTQKEFRKRCQMENLINTFKSY